MVPLARLHIFVLQTPVSGFRQNDRPVQGCIMEALTLQRPSVPRRRWFVFALCLFFLAINAGGPAFVLNSGFIVTNAGAIATRLLSPSRPDRNDRERIRQAYLLLYGRAATERTHSIAHPGWRRD